jgi:N-acyl-phosphatidylethanolamine-hydrolysing phospholipase D
MILNPIKEQVQVTWIGHASFLVQFDGLNILTDPIFSERCSPMQWAGPKRIVPAPFPSSELPYIHICIISHNHYDHLVSNERNINC